MYAAIAFMVFVVVTLGVFALLSLLDQRQSQARTLRDRLSATQKPDEAPVDVALLRDEMMSRIPAFDTLLRRSERVTILQKMLTQGEVNVRAGNFLLFCVLSSVVFGLVFMVAGGKTFFGWAGLILGFFIPYAYASHRRAKRFQRFEEKFPEAIDTLARAVRAGHAFTTALELIASEVSEPVAGEFRQLFEEQKFGLPVRDALINLADRIPLVDVKFFVTAVMLQRETGGNLAEILDNLSYVIRERFKILRQVRVHTAQGRLTMVLLMALPPTIVVVMLIMNPGFIQPLFTDPIGHALIVGGITLQTLGYFVIRRIIRIQV
jgi:tight adherence protein B